MTVTLPEPTLAKPVVDPARSHVANRDRGLVNRIAGVFTDNPTSERELYLTAQQRLAKAAKGSELRARAEANTDEMLQGLLGKLGFERVNVVFSSSGSGARRPRPSSRRASPRPDFAPVGDARRWEPGAVTTRRSSRPATGG